MVILVISPESIGGITMTTIKKELIRELIKNKNPEELIGKNGLIKELVKEIVECAMEAEMTNHLGYEKYDPKGKNSGNSRNGKSTKTLKGDQGELEIEVPRDRNGEFEPIIIGKHQRRFTGFDDKITAMYARGMTTRDIQSLLKDIYGVDVSPNLISEVTDEIIKEVTDWQNRPLDPIYPILYLDALMVNIRDEGHIRKKAVFLALGVNMEGHKELLGIWIENTEGAKFWLRVVTELHNRGIKDIFIACVDGLKGFGEAINSVYPKTEIQQCIIHMIRNSLKYVSYKDRKQVAESLKKIYQAATEEQARIELDKFSEIWDDKYPLISKSWENNWDGIMPFFAYPDYIRKAIYTTNAIESLNMSLRKVLKTKGSFPNDEAVFKQLYLAVGNASKKWTMPIRNWGLALNQFAISYGDRMPSNRSFTQNS